MTKICTRCSEPKAIDDFPLSGGNGRRAAMCRPCKQVYDREYYQTNKPKMREQRKLTRPEAKRRVQQAVWNYLAEHPCPCGETDPVVLEFDHRDPKEKIDSVCEMINRRFSLGKIMAEIAKCDVLCANCHRRRTAEQFGWYKLLETK